MASFHTAPPMPIDAKSAAPIDQNSSPVSITAPVHIDDVPPEIFLPAAACRRMGIRQTKGQQYISATFLAVYLAIVLAVAPISYLWWLAADLPWDVLFIDLPVNTLGLSDVPWGVLAAGFFAQIVDGSLGMGYGITSATVLTSLTGLTPAAASSAVHLAQLGTTAVSGYSHKRCGNVDAPTLSKLTPAGVLGAALGSTALTSLASATSKLVSSSMLFAVGSYVLVRFARSDGEDGRRAAGKPSLAFLGPLGLVGGLLDAMGGGGWGPVATSGLLAEGRLPPSLAIGTVSLSEFFVTVSAVCGFLLSLGPSHLIAGDGAGALALALLAGGLLAAPIAPLLVCRVAPRRLGVIVGAFICLTNVRVLVNAWLRA